MKTVVWGVMPVGALTGGALGSTIGIVPTICVGAVVMLSAIPWLFVREIRALPCTARAVDCYSSVIVRPNSSADSG
jgi:hypothetical protein